MNETEDDILNSIKTWVWSGFYTANEVDGMISDVLEDEVDEDAMRAAVAPEFKRKATEERGWPKTTDCDRLNAAFRELDSIGIIALQNAGYTMSDGRSDVGEVLQERGRKGVKGYCFYHGQDLERAVAGDGLMLAFGDLDAEAGPKLAVGCLIRDVLKKHGLAVEWDEDPEKRLHIPQIDWKRRYSAP